LLEELTDGVLSGDRRPAKVKFVEAAADGVEGMDFEAFGEARLIVNERAEFVAESVGEDFGECGEKDSGIGLGTGEEDGAMERDDSFAGAGGTGDAGRAVVIAFDEGALGGVEEDGPLVPREFEGALQFLHVAHETEPALGVGVGEGVGGNGGDRYNRGNTRSQAEQGFGSLGREVSGQIEERVFGGLADFGEPFGRDAVAQDLGVRHMDEQGCFEGDGLRRRIHIARDSDLLNDLTDFDELGRSRFGVSFEFAAFRPMIGVVVMADIAEQETGFGAVQDEADVTGNSNGPEALVLSLVEFVKLEAGVGGIELQVEGRGFRGFLLVASETGQAFGEGIGDTEFHGQMDASTRRCKRWSKSEPGSESFTGRGGVRIREFARVAA